MVDGAVWPVVDENTVWLPPGPHRVEPADHTAGVHLVRLNADLKSARVLSGSGIEFSYQSSARAIAILDRLPLHLQIDGSDVAPGATTSILLPRGAHVVCVRAE